MKIHHCIQGELEWTMLRLGRPTASEFHHFMTSDFEMRKPDVVRAYAFEKVAEKILGHALPGGSSWETEQGQILEHEARGWTGLKLGAELRQVGFIESEDGLTGCSPDALIGESMGAEIKCPQPKAHTQYLYEGRVPLEYVAQVHGSMYVTGASKWYFVSYRRKPFGKLLLLVKREEEIMTKIAACIAKFYAVFKEVLAKVI